MISLVQALELEEKSLEEMNHQWGKIDPKMEVPKGYVVIGTTNKAAVLNRAGDYILDKWDTDKPKDVWIRPDPIFKRVILKKDKKTVEKDLVMHSFWYNAQDWMRSYVPSGYLILRKE